MTTKIQAYTQAHGPSTPNVCNLAIMMLKQLPGTAQVDAVSINGQTGAIVVEYTKDDLSYVYEMMRSADET